MAISTNLNMLDQLKKVEERIGSMDEIAGKGLNQPFAASNSGARKILASTQFDHIAPLAHPELACIQTGYENRYGDFSSSLIEATTNMEVVAKIEKYSFAPGYHFWLICKEKGTNRYDIVERKFCTHTTQTYGFIYNNTKIDKLRPGDEINEGDILRESTSYDKFKNRIDGVNMYCGYIATSNNMEDSLIYSMTGAKKLDTVEVKEFENTLNLNDIPLNLYGTDTEYKSFPDVGEEIKNGLFMAYRRENREESLYMQASYRLKELMMSDEKITVEGQVVDIDIKFNNADILDTAYNKQLKKYYEEHLRFCRELVGICNNIKLQDPTANFCKDLGEMYWDCNTLLNGGQYVKDDKVFSHCLMKVTIVHTKPMLEGDKGCDRYGGKGVCSFIIPDWLMPTDSYGRALDCIVSQPTCVNRENPGQLKEMSLNHIAMAICDRILYSKPAMRPREAMDLILEFLIAVSPEEGYALKNLVQNYDEDDIAYMVDSCLDKQRIITSLKPVSDTMSIDKIAEIYDKFPWIEQTSLTVPIKDSTGNYRFVKSHRKIVCAWKYMYRLKQYAEDKFSATSLSATNLKNQNTRNKSSKVFKAPHSNTPVAQGNMEIDDQSHLGIEFVVTNLMINSVSPQARRLCEQMLTGNPFDVNIKLNSDSKNIAVEQFNAYMKAKGLRLNVVKHKKETVPLITVMDMCKVPQYLIQYIDENKNLDLEMFSADMEANKDPDHVVNLINFIKKN